MNADGDRLMAQSFAWQNRFLKSAVAGAQRIVAVAPLQFLERCDTARSPIPCPERLLGGKQQLRELRRMQGGAVDRSPVHIRLSQNP